MLIPISRVPRPDARLRRRSRWGYVGMLVWLYAMCLTSMFLTPLGAQTLHWRSAAGGVAPTGAMPQQDLSPIQYPIGVDTSLSFNPPQHQINDLAGPLAPQYGEVRIDGLITSDFDSSSSQFVMHACAYTQATGAHGWLSEPRDKVVLTSNATLLSLFGASESQMALHASDDHPYHVTVVGVDQGTGMPIAARIVWVERATIAELTFVANQGTGGKARRPADPPSPAISVSHPVISFDGHSFTATVVRIRLSTVRVRAGIARNQVGATESLGGIAVDNGAIAAINGSFFDSYDDGPYKMPDMELISGGTTVFKARTGTLIGFTPDGKCIMERSVVADALRNLDPAYPDDWDAARPQDVLLWQQVTEAVGCGPRLVRDGAVAVSPFTEGFSSEEVLNTTTRRSAVGFTSAGTLLLVSVSANIPNLAHVMKALGCTQAMNLDGGSSSGLWVRGAYLQRPRREISNALLILAR